MLYYFNRTVKPELICRGGHIYKIRDMLDSYIVKGVTINTNEKGIIIKAYLHDCIHPNASSNLGVRKGILVTEDMLKTPLPTLEFCIPPWFTLGNFKMTEDNIQKLIDVIEIWNLDDCFWSGHVPIELDRNNSLIEEFKSRYKFIGDSPIDLSSFEIINEGVLEIKKEEAP